MRKRRTHREDAMYKKSVRNHMVSNRGWALFLPPRHLPFTVRPSTYARTQQQQQTQKNATAQAYSLSLPFHEWGAREEEVQDELFRHIMTREIGVRLRNCVWLPI